ncbi:MAG: Mrp/NBP35 family ATP-binding protein [Chloroflexi bacterium]|jgi:Mrp family chromosome partitioning ATPase|nr:Mrp/NBP35 family ATP-binding protein [Chloroflexota bacterium]MBT7288943.1 Mrp/NBP35 family ATP-binding protein [Chloroflexota bacterium]
MVTQDQVSKAISELLVPGVGRSLTDLNLLKSIEVADGKVTVTVANAAIGEGTQDWIRTKIATSVEKIADGLEITTEFVDAKPTDVNQVGKVIAIMSGKGGVGKSLITGLSAVALARQGKSVGILDADITGPSIPKMFGMKTRPISSKSGILPIISHLGIEVMSINLMLENEHDAVIWRGPVISGAIKQFWEEVLWGKLDYLLVDLPPGTADAPLTVMQTLPVNGVIIVSTPQELASMVVRKAVTMAQKLDKPVLGVVENMSYLEIPETGKRMELFGKSRGQEVADAANAPLLATLPLDPKLAALCDAGEVEKYSTPEFDAFSKAFTEIALKSLKSNHG